MTKTDAAWIAGFLDGNGFQININRGRRNAGKKTYGAPNLLLQTVRAERLEMLEKLSVLTGGSLSRAGTGRTFGERFEHEGRPAQYTDGSSSHRYQFFLSCSKIQKLYPQIIRYLSAESAARLLPILEYNLDGAKSTAGKKGNEVLREKIIEVSRTPLDSRLSV